MKCSYSFYFVFMTSTVTLCFLTEKKTLLRPKRTEWLIAWRYVKTSWHSRWGMQQSMDGHVRLRIIRFGHILWVICKSLLMLRLGRHFSPVECKFSEGIQDEKSWFITGHLAKFDVNASSFQSPVLSAWIHLKNKSFWQTAKSIRLFYTFKKPKQKS